MQPDRKHLNPGRSIPFSPCKSVPIFLIYVKNALINLSLLGAASFKTITAMKKHLQQQVFFQLYSPFGELYYYTEIFASRVCE